MTYGTFSHTQVLVNQFDFPELTMNVAVLTVENNMIVLCSFYPYLYYFNDVIALSDWMKWFKFFKFFS